MDLLTQGLLGAAVVQLGVRHRPTPTQNRSERIVAGLVGFLAGLLADADMLIRSAEDSLLTIEYHRHFTHSLFFIPLGALVAASLCWLFLHKRLSFKTLYWYCLLGYLCSGLLDACTSYGTHLLWPLNNERIAWHLISIVDPVFTLTLAVGVFMSIKRDSLQPAKIALLLCSIYLAVGYLQQQRVQQHMQLLAENRGHSIERYIVKPTIGNLILWRSVYQAEDRYYVDAIRVGISDIRIYEGETISALHDATTMGDIEPDSIQHRDIARFKHFSSDFVVVDPDNPNILGDVRYSIFPTSVKPLWGIVLDRENPLRHASYQFFRQHDDESRKLFLDMLLGHDIPAS